MKKYIISLVLVVLLSVLAYIGVSEAFKYIEREEIKSEFKAAFYNLEKEESVRSLIQTTHQRLGSNKSVFDISKGEANKENCISENSVVEAWRQKNIDKALKLIASPCLIQ